MHANKKLSGFTIVELLIVVVVIAILAAISVLAYTGIQDRAIASTVKSDLSNFAKRMEIVRVDSADELYPSRTAISSAMGFRVTKNAYTLTRSNWVYCPSSDRSDYALGVLDSKGVGYLLTSRGGIQEDVRFGGAETCAAVGVTGGTAIYNLGYTWSSSANTGTWSSWVN